MNAFHDYLFYYQNLFQTLLLDTGFTHITQQLLATLQRAFSGVTVPQFLDKIKRAHRVADPWLLELITNIQVNITILDMLEEDHPGIVPVMFHQI